MATDVIYNGIELHNCVTRGWEQEIVYDESGTDQLFTRYKLRFECVMHAQYLYAGSNPVYVAPYGATQIEDFSKNYNVVRSQLQQPRQSLKVKMGGTTVLQCGATGAPGLPNSDQDVDNGPKPKTVSITHVAANVFRIVFEVECSKAECSGTSSLGGGGNPKILNNRWSIQETLDDKFFMTRTISGRMRVSSGIDPNAYRYLVVPALEPGFRRDRLDYTVTPSGLEATYTVTDRQTTLAAPWPAARISGTHSEGTNDGVTWNSQIRVRLEGHPGADKRVLLQWAVAMVENRIVAIEKLNYIKDPSNPKTYIVESCVITDNLGDDNSIELSLAVKHIAQPTKDEKGNSFIDFANLNAAKIGSPVDLVNSKVPYKHDRKSSPVPSPWGYSLETADKPRDPSLINAMMRCYLQVPCSDNHGINNNRVPYKSESTSTTKISGKTAPESTLPPWDSNQAKETDSHKSAMYTICTASSAYRTRQCKVPAPLAVQSADDSNTCAILSLGPPQMIRTIHTHNERVGEWPEIPKPLETYEDNGVKATLIDHWIDACPPATTVAGAGSIYRLEAWYLYALARPLKSSDKYKVGALPFVATTQGESSFKPDDAYAQRLAPDGGETAHA